MSDQLSLIPESQADPPPAILPDGNSYSESELRFARYFRISKAMLEIGVSEEQVSRLINRYPADVIEQQLEWLPFRKAKKLASMLVSSIEKNYEPPAALYDQAN